MVLQIFLPSPVIHELSQFLHIGLYWSNKPSHSCLYAG